MGHELEKRCFFPHGNSLKGSFHINKRLTVPLTIQKAEKHDHHLHCVPYGTHVWPPKALTSNIGLLTSLRKPFTLSNAHNYKKHTLKVWTENWQRKYNVKSKRKTSLRVSVSIVGGEGYFW